VPRSRPIEAVERLSDRRLGLHPNALTGACLDGRVAGEKGKSQLTETSVARPGDGGTASHSAARPASTVILLRRAAPGFELLLVRRLASASSFADVFVFPGGALRADDEQAPTNGGLTPAEAMSRLTERGGNPPASDSSALAFHRAAIRELFEEAGVLLARDRAGNLARLDDSRERWAIHREALQAGRRSLAEILESERLLPDDRGLIYFSHWVAPLEIPRRFDTRFFVGEMPEAQTTVHCQVETTESIWISPRLALDRADAGALPLVFPTRMHLRRLAALATYDDALAYARAKRIVTVQPMLGPGNTPVNLDHFDERAEW
jgi:8-oxo-dGTP pyrophosphatase MutT (NUDIX family)